MRLSLPRLTSLALAAVVAIGATVWLWQTRDEQPGAEVPRQDVKPPPSQFQGVRLTDEDPDGTRWTLNAEAGTAWESEGTGRLRGVTAMFQRRGKKIELKAREGAVSRGDTVVLSGDVVVTGEGFVARTENARYSRGQGMVRSEGDLTLTGPRLSVRGKGLEVDVEGRTARILSDVRAIVGGPKE